MYMSYRIRIECGNCHSRNNHDVTRGTPCNDADLVCPNCGCCPTLEDFSVMVDNNLSRHITKSENET